MSRWLSQWPKLLREARRKKVPRKSWTQQLRKLFLKKTHRKRQHCTTTGAPPEDMDTERTGQTEETGGQMTFFEHLIELRKRIINSLIAIALGAAAGWFVAPKFVNVIAKPIQTVLAAHHYNAQL